MDICLLCLYVVLSCVNTGLCDGLITRPEESYRGSNCMCDHRNPERVLCSSWEPKGKLMNEVDSEIDLPLTIKTRFP
jgi:hypothetical protein